MTKTDMIRPPSAAARPSDGRRWIALAVLCVSLLIVVLDNTVLNVVLPTLVRDLHATSTELQWIVDSYVIVFAGLLLVAGSVADRVGRKRTFVAGLVAFAAGSTWAAFSGSVGMLIAARASMGIGGALIMPSTLSIITDMFGNRDERQRAIGLWAGTSGVGVALGPIIGGLLLAHFWWGSVFLINVPIALLGLVFALPLVPDSRKAAAPAPDLVGAALSVAGLGLVLWSIIEAPVRGWSSGRVIGAGVAGVVVLTAFGLWERTRSHPMLNLGLFRRRAFTGAISSVWLVTFGLFSTLFVLTQYLQFSLGFTALQTGLRVLPAAGAVAVVAPVSALFVRWFGTKITVAAGLLFIAAGLWQVSLASTATTYPGIVTGMILLGVGAGLGIPSATGSVMGSVPREDTGVGAATNGAVMQVGGALGVAVIGSLLATRYQDKMTAALVHYPVPHDALTAILGSLGGALAVAARAGGVTGALLAGIARTAFVSGMDLGLRTAAAVGLVGVLIAVIALPARRARNRAADARGADAGGAEVRGAEAGSADAGSADAGGADAGGAEAGGAEVRGAEAGGAEVRGAEVRSAEAGGAEAGGAEVRGAEVRGADARGAEAGGAAPPQRQPQVPPQQPPAPPPDGSRPPLALPPTETVESSRTVSS